MGHLPSPTSPCSLPLSLSFTKDLCALRLSTLCHCLGTSRRLHPHRGEVLTNAHTQGPAALEGIPRHPSGGSELAPGPQGHLLHLCAEIQTQGRFQTQGLPHSHGPGQAVSFGHAKRFISITWKGAGTCCPASSKDAPRWEPRDCQGGE